MTTCAPRTAACRSLPEQRFRRADGILPCRKKLFLLSGLIASDEGKDKLICDFAQYYHVLDWRSLPVRLAATLAAGLPPDSRCMMHLAGQKLPEKTLMDAAAVDALHRIEWRLIGCPGSRPPDSILAALTDPDTGGTGNVQSFDSPEDFEAALAAMKGG